MKNKNSPQTKDVLMVSIYASDKIEKAIGYSRVGKVKEAISELRKVSKYEANSAPVLLVISDVYLDNKKYEEAERAAREVVKRYPNLSHGYINLGVALKQLGRFVEAREVLLVGLEADPTNGVLLFNLGCCHSLLGEVGLARRAVAEAARVAPWLSESAASEPDLRQLLAVSGRPKVVG